MAEKLSRARPKPPDPASLSSSVIKTTELSCKPLEYWFDRIPNRIYLHLVSLLTSSTTQDSGGWQSLSNSCAVVRDRVQTAYFTIAITVQRMQHDHNRYMRMELPLHALEGQMSDDTCISCYHPRVDAELIKSPISS